MKKVVLLAFIGLICFACSIFMFFIFMNNIEQTYGLIFLAASILVGLAGGVILYKAGTIDVNTPNFAKPSAPTQVETQIEKNNKMAAEWNKTNESRDKLKVLQVAAEAEGKK